MSVIDIDVRGEDSGEYYPSTRRGYANPAKCTNLDDFINTIQHENVHLILDQEFGTTAEQDHWALNIIEWSEEYLNGEKKL